MDIVNLIMFATALIDQLKDTYETWKDKDEQIFTKVIFSIVVLEFIYLSARLWL